jgi:hypothetical protein
MEIILLVGAIGLALFGWRASRQGEVLVSWSTVEERNIAGFNLYRSVNLLEDFVRINTELVSAHGDPLLGGDYTYPDLGLEPGKTYYYILEQVDTSGRKQRKYPMQASAQPGGFSQLLAAGALTLFSAGWPILIARTSTGSKRTPPKIVLY